MKKPFAFLFGLTIIIFIAAIQIINAIGFLLGIPITSALVLPATVICCAVVCWWGSKVYFPTNPSHMFIRVMIWASIIVMSSLMLSSLIYDWSWDGQSYHSQAVILLANRWNPVNTPLPDGVYAQLLSFSTKGPWITEATIFQATKSIEAAKGINLAILIATFAISLAALSNLPTIRPRQAFYFSLLMFLNPVVIAQLFSFYIDGQLACYITVLINLIFMLETIPSKRTLYLSVMIVSILLINVKLNGAIYLSIFAVGYLIWQLWKRQFKQAVLLVQWLVGAFVIGVLIVGYNPYITQYVTQTIQHNNPFYPTQWDEIFAITPNTPANLIGKDRFSKMFISLFSASSDDKIEAKLKVPFSLNRDELLAFLSANARSGGFGPFFSGALLLCIIIGTVFLIYNRNSLKIPLVLFLGAVVIISSLVVSEGWWARYVPQFWLAPILIVIGMKSEHRQRLIQWGNYIIISTLSINVIAICTIYLASIYQLQTRYENDMKVISEWTSQNGSLPVYVAEFPITRQRLEQFNIPYNEIDPNTCSLGDRQRILPSYGWMCVSTPLYEQPESPSIQ